MRFIEKQNPQFRERHVESARPGELLSQDTFYVGHFKGVGKVYLHAVMDTYSRHAFGFLHTSKQPEAAVSVVHNDVVSSVLPFYKKHKLKLGALLTDNGTEFCGMPEHPYELYLALCEVEHRRTKVRRLFVERFNRTVKEEFFDTVTRTTLYTSLERLQDDLDK